MPGCVPCTPGPRPPPRRGPAGVAGWWLYPASPVRRSLTPGVDGRPCGDRVSVSHRRVRGGGLSTGACVGVTAAERVGILPFPSESGGRHEAHHHITGAVA